MDFYPIAGYGPVTNDRCNTITYADVCFDGHRYIPRFYHCHNWACPTCLPWTASAAAKEVADRLYGGFWAWRAIGRHPGNLNHLTLSVPASEYVDFDPDKARKKATALAKQIGISGGSIVFHQPRIKKELKKRITDACRILGVRGGWWAGVRANVLGLPSVADYLEEGPHFHFTGCFFIKETSDHFFKRTGWVYKNITISHGRLYETKEALRKIVAYQLEHHSIVSPNEHAVRWFGTFSYRVLEMKKVKVKESLECPVCSKQMYKVVVNSERYLVELKAGLHRFTVDENSIPSRRITVKKFFSIRTEQATMNMYHSIPPPVC
jgi:hypothetical protein